MILYPNSIVFESAAPVIGAEIPPDKSPPMSEAANGWWWLWREEWSPCHLTYRPSNSLREENLQAYVMRPGRMSEYALFFDPTDASLVWGGRLSLPVVE